MKYDRQQVIEKATNLFWDKGFHATSMRDLQEAIDMRPGSIYAAFGSKDGLFKEALQHYTEQSLSDLKALAANAPSPLEGLKLVIRTMTQGCKESPNGVCMLVKTATELTEEHADLLQESKRLLTVVEETFAEMLQKAKDAGELSESSDPEQLARFLQMQLMGLRSYALANDGNIPADALLEDAFACLQ